jgi:hypothetical protein
MEKIKIIFNYLFFRVYKVFSFINGKEDAPHITAWLYITFICYFLCLPIIKVNQYLQSLFSKCDRSLYLILLIAICTIIYFAFIFRSKYLKIISLFTDEKKHWKIIGNLLIITLTCLVIYLNFIKNL